MKHRIFTLAQQTMQQWISARDLWRYQI